MIITIDWEVFHSRYYLDNMIYVKENDTNFEFITNIDGLIIKTVKDKHFNDEENIIFIKRYLTDKKNLVKVISFGEEEETVETDTIDEDFVEELE